MGETPHSILLASMQTLSQQVIEKCHFLLAFFLAVRRAVIQRQMLRHKVGHAKQRPKGVLFRNERLTELKDGSLRRCVSSLDWKS